MIKTPPEAERKFLKRITAVIATLTPSKERPPKETTEEVITTTEPEMVQRRPLG